MPPDFNAAAAAARHAIFRERMFSDAAIIADYFIFAAAADDIIIDATLFIILKRGRHIDERC